GGVNADASIEDRQGNAADQHRQQEYDHADRADQDRDNYCGEGQCTQTQQSELEPQAQLLEVLRLVEHQYRQQKQQKRERDEQRRALEEKQRVETEQRT